MSYPSPDGHQPMNTPFIPQGSPNQYSPQQFPPNAGANYPPPYNQYPPNAGSNFPPAPHQLPPNPGQPVIVHVQSPPQSAPLGRIPVLGNVPTRVVCPFCKTEDLTNVTKVLDNVKALILILIALTGICICALCCLCTDWCHKFRHSCRHCGGFIGEATEV